MPHSQKPTVLRSRRGRLPRPKICRPPPPPPPPPPEAWPEGWPEVLHCSGALLKYAPPIWGGSYSFDLSREATPRVYSGVYTWFDASTLFLRAAGDATLDFADWTAEAVGQAEIFDWAAPADPMGGLPAASGSVNQPDPYPGVASLSTSWYYP